jgi:hypothetical protein
VLRRYFEHASEHFGSDELGRGRVRRFFLWHLQFWHRYRAYGEQDHLAAAPEPLIQQRAAPVGGDGDEALLASPAPADHETIWMRVTRGEFPTA